MTDDDRFRPFDAAERSQSASAGGSDGKDTKEGRDSDAWEFISPIPDSVPAPTMSHWILGDAVRTWLYRDLIGARVCYVARYDTADGGKEFWPQTWRKHRTTGEYRWRWKNVPSPRPLYGAELLAQRPKADVWVAEGEGKCDALRRIFPDCVVVSPMGGAKAPHKSDWIPLLGRHVKIWRDNDQAGEGFERAVFGLLRGIAASVVAVDVERLIALDGGNRPANRKVAGWDAADAEREWTDLDALRAAVLASIKRPESSGWGPLGNLGAAKLPPVLPFDPRLLPEPFMTWAVDESERMPCAIDFVAVSIIVFAASVVGASCGLRPKRDDNWIVAIIFWGMLIGPPGDMKSPAMTAAAKPLLVLIKEAKAKHEEEMLAYGVEKRRYDALMGALEERMKKAAKSRDNRDTETASVAAEIAELETQAPKEPIHRRYETNDATVEKFIDLLCDNPRGLMQRLDELTRLVLGFERPEHAGDRGTYLEGYEGFQPRQVDRIKRGSRHVEHNCITLFGGIQPDAFAMWADMTTDLSRNDGFLQRFGLMVYPNSAVWSWVNRKPVPGAYEMVVLIFRKLSDFDPVAWGAIPGEEGKVPGFRYSPAAQDVFIRWLTELRTVRIPTETDQSIRQHLTKYDRVFCSLSLIFHLIERAEHEIRSGVDRDGNVEYGFPSEVSEGCARRAAAWLVYLESHMRRCYALIGHHRIRNANALAERIARGDLQNGFTRHVVLRRQWAGLKTADELTAALTWLESENWIRAVPVVVGKQGGRPSQGYEIHPDLLAGQKGGDRVGLA